MEDYISFSIRPAVEYQAVQPSQISIDVRLSYPVEYTKIDKTNYIVEVVDGYKTISYSDQFYEGYGFSFNLYKPRVPVNSLIGFLALWALLIVGVARVRVIAARKDSP